MPRALRWPYRGGVGGFLMTELPLYPGFDKDLGGHRWRWAGPTPRRPRRSTLRAPPARHHTPFTSKGDEITRPLYRHHTPFQRLLLGITRPLHPRVKISHSLHIQGRRHDTLFTSTSPAPPDRHQTPFTHDITRHLHPARHHTPLTSGIASASCSTSNALYIDITRPFHTTSHALSAPPDRHHTRLTFCPSHPRHRTPFTSTSHALYIQARSDIARPLHLGAL